MQEPEHPSDEAERLAALQGLCILDSPPEERFDRYTRLARRLFGVPIALVSLVDADRQWFKSRQGLGATETGRDISFCGHAILGSDAFVIENTLEDERFEDNPLVTSDPNIRFYAGYPLPGPGGHRLGTLCIIDREPRDFGPEDQEALADIGAMVASELAALQLATTDPLTQVSNRRGFEALSRQSLAACSRDGRPAVVLMIDMDDFKPINDTYGHQEGDHALVAFSTLLLETLRESDVVGRIGGDEFCALLTGTTEDQAHKAVARRRVAVDAYNRAAGKPYDLAFSAGIVAHCSERHDCLSQLLDEADAQMYAQKRSRKPAA